MRFAYSLGANQQHIHLFLDQLMQFIQLLFAADMEGRHSNAGRCDVDRSLRGGRPELGNSLEKIGFFLDARDSRLYLLLGHMQINLSRLLASMAEHLLRSADIVALIDDPGSKEMAKHMRIDDSVAMFFQSSPDHFAAEVGLVRLSRRWKEVSIRQFAFHDTPIIDEGIHDSLGKGNNTDFILCRGALFEALHQDRPIMEVEMFDLESDDLGDAEASVGHEEGDELVFFVERF
ncbi:MAG: hypothetical protein R2828_29965 [Saprospiraceae bacterium]